MHISLRAASSRQNLICETGLGKKKKVGIPEQSTYRTCAAKDATFSKIVVSLYSVYCLSNVPKIDDVL